MVETSENNAAWAQQWIEQQRALLEGLARAGTASAGNGAEASQGLGGQWGGLGQAFMAGLLQMAQQAGVAPGTADAGANFESASEAFDVWRSVSSNSLAQASAPGGWADLFNRSPPLGLFREQTEAWRALAAAQADCQRLEQEFAAVLRRVQGDALNLLEERVQARADAGNAVQSFRELYDLWVECSELVFSGVAHSSAYCHLQAELGNAAMRRRARVQKIIEHGLKQFDLPTRSEINSVHLQLRVLKQRLAELQAASAKAPAPAEPRASSRAKRKGAPATRTARKRSP